ncbi:MAG: 6-phosphogluconolactonase [Tepidisphaeraceae bacterium]
MSVEPEIKVFPNSAALVEEAAKRIVHSAAQAAAEGNLFSLFLSGGSTPKALYELLASDEWKTQLDWRNVELYFGDERCVPPDSALSNYKMALETLIDRVPIPRDNVYRMRGEIEPEVAAKEYGQMLKEKFRDEGPDVLLLGMGDDGHTASLFPGTAALDETHHRCVANHVTADYIPKGTSWRITLTYPFINLSKQVLILVTGASKAERLSEVLEGEPAPSRLPIQGVQPTAGKLSYLIDVAAAGM